MSESLRDQLLKSGLARTLKPEPKLPEKPQPRPGDNRNRQRPASPAQRATPQNAARPAVRNQDEVDLARAYALRARQEKEERERVQREAERVSREKKERKQKLATLLDGKAVNAADADVARHFPHGTKIRRVYCTAEQLPRLNRGDLAVVQIAGRYLLVERDIALQAQSIQADALVLLCDPDAPAEDDVPADLVW